MQALPESASRPLPARRFRFGLRTVFVVLTVMGIALAVGALKLRQDTARDRAFNALNALGMQTSIASLPGGLALKLVCQSTEFGDADLELLATQLATLQQAHDLGLSPGMQRIEVDLVKSSVTDEGESRLHRALPTITITR